MYRLHFRKEMDPFLTWTVARHWNVRCHVTNYVPEVQKQVPCT
jgi:hypothetical protein